MPAESSPWPPMRWSLPDASTHAAAIQRVVNDHDGDAVLLAVNPMLDNLQDDARFVALVHQVGLTLPELFTLKPALEMTTCATAPGCTRVVSPITHRNGVETLR